MLTCTWAPTVFNGPRVVGGDTTAQNPWPEGEHLQAATVGNVQRIESLGVSHLLIAQRWWGSGTDIEGSSLDCLAMTAYFAAQTERLHLVTAIHPGFFHPSAIAKWGATLDRMTGGRWSINVTSGWNLDEFEMYGIDALEHDARYARSMEFIRVLRGAWAGQPFSFNGEYYKTNDLQLEPPPIQPLQVFQGGQSPAALAMAGAHSDWMFLNGGRPEKIAGVIERAQASARTHGRQLRFALYAAPLCRDTDAQAWQEIDARLERIDPQLLEARRARVGGAQGMWGAQDGEDPLRHLDTNEGYCSRLIGSPATIWEQITAYKDMGIDMLHLDLTDQLFNAEILGRLEQL